MKLSWKLFAAFYFPLHFAVGSFYAADRVLDGQTDCRYMCVWMENCAGQETLLIADIFIYSGISLVLLSLFLPSLMFYRQQEIIQTSIFD